MVPFPLKLPFPTILGNGGKPIQYPPMKDGNYVDCICTNCNGGVDESDHKKKISDVPGAGGCISLDDWVYQDGANGNVRLICEQWEK